MHKTYILKKLGIILQKLSALINNMAHVKLARLIGTQFKIFGIIQYLPLHNL